MSYPTHGNEFHERTGWASPCRAATTGNITISTGLNNGDTIDGVTLATGDRVLVKDQTTGSQNGIYIVGASPARAVDYADSGNIVGSVVVVSEGTVNADSMWQCTTNAPITVGTTALVFASAGGGGGGGGGTSDLYVVVTDPTYGAVGDGTTDDTAAIQAAIDATPDYATCFFPAGEYKITATLTIPGSIRLLGVMGLKGSVGVVPDGGSVIKMVTNNTTAISTTDLSKLTVEQLTIRNTGLKASGKGIYALGSVITKHVFVDSFYDGIFIDGVSGDAYNCFINETFASQCTRAGIYLDGKVNNIHIRGLVAGTCQYGIYASGGIYGATIEACDIEACTISGITIDGTGSSQTTDSILISGCYFDNQSPATSNISIGPTTLVQGVTIDQCYFEINAGATAYHLDVNHCDRLIVSGSHFKHGVEAGSIRCNATNTTNVTLINVKADHTVTTPATTRILDQTDVTPAATSTANAVGSSKYLARADHVHQTGSGAPSGTAGGDLSGTYPNPTVAKINGSPLGTISSPAAGDRLRWGGSAWVNSPLIWAPVMVLDPGSGNYLVLTDSSGNPIMAEV